jgi:hypothetical protein
MTEYLWHLLALPVYFVLSTARHEIGHALGAVFLGLTVDDIQVLPHWRDERYHMHFWPGEGRRFCWGSTIILGCTGPLKDRRVLLAPFALGAGFALGGLWAVPMTEVTFGLHGWIAAAVLCWLSPAVDALWALVKWFIWDAGDMARSFGESTEP